MPVDPNVHIPLAHVSWFHALLLGVIQGATEFLPVSSTAHMRIIPALLGWKDPGTAFSAVVQLGPMAAIIAYFRNQITSYLAGMGRSLKAKRLFPEGDVPARLGWYTAFGTIPLIVFGLALEHKVDHQYRNLYLVAGALILLGVFLALAEKIGKKTDKLEKLTFGNAMIIGLSQALALVPGASRSGCTITSGLFCGLTREDAADFSFLLSIPAITLAGLYKLVKSAKQSHLGPELASYVFASVIAGIVAYVVIKLFLDYLKDDKHTTGPFIAYRIVLGLAIIGLVQANMLSPQQMDAQTSGLRIAKPIPSNIAMVYSPSTWANVPAPTSPLALARIRS